MPSSIFGISVSGLLSNQAALNTTANNIANVNTEGYSRQRVSQTPRTSEFIGGNFFGSGVEIGDVKRIFDQVNQFEIQAAKSNFMQLDSFFAQASRVDGLLADSQNGLNNSLQSFFSSLQEVVNDPASIAARQVMLGQAEGLTSKFESIHIQLDGQLNQVNTNIDSIAKEITSLGQSIANLNNQIAGTAGNPAPDVLDQRNLAINRLSELVAVQTTQQSDGSFNIFIGTGQSLVVGSLSNSLIVTADPQNPRAVSLNLVAGTSSIDITSNISGGSLGGLLNVVEDIIDPAFNTLGRIAISIADTFNSQSNLGMDLNNNLGRNLFTDINDPALVNSRISSNVNNTGNVNLNISIDDPSMLTDSNYTLLMQGGNYQLIDQTTNTTVATFAPPAIVPSSVRIAPPIGTDIGISINFQSGSANNGDSFEVQPVRNFSRDVKLAISTPEQIAAASPIRGEQAQSNIGSGEIINITVNDTSTVQFTTTPNNLAPPIRIQFDTTAGEFSLFDMTSGSPVLLIGGVTGFVNNQTNNMLALAGAPYDSYGYEISIAGEPQAGDSFDINYNNNGGGNNDNALQLADLQQFAGLDNGKSSFQQAFGRIIGKVGVTTQSAEINKNAAQGILFQAEARREAVSGVNLDEEASNLLQFQQAYQASAQVISIARTLFQTVLDAVR